ncbi:MAG TPA: type III pantothenate kinase [Bacteroidota bacterium]|nr:type III pantothenate kinase [Bacteroidota bacterium]
MTVLAIDIGNSRMSLGLFKGKNMSAPFHVSSSGLSRGKAHTLLSGYLRKSRVGTDDLSGIVICSVVPRATKIVASVCKSHLKKDPLVITGKLDAGIKILYKTPATLGADRICSVVAAFEKYKRAVIVVDAGTATTISVVSEKGEFLGGAIAPGIKTSASALHGKTAQLPDIPLRFPNSVIGNSTIESIQSGILFGAISSIEGIVRRTKLETGKRTKVVLTGGFARLLVSKTDIADAVEPALVLHGARLIFQHVMERNKKG